MAFDMYAGERSERIDHHEEFLFSLVAADESEYPQLMSIWERFYDGPCLAPEQAGAIVHELIELLSNNGGEQGSHLAKIVMRLLPFFSFAYKRGLKIKCSSD